MPATATKVNPALKAHFTHLTPGKGGAVEGAY